MENPTKGDPGTESGMTTAQGRETALITFSACCQTRFRFR